MNAWEIKSHIWNGWSSNMVYDDGGPGYIVHMCEEAESGWPERSLCGVKIRETGALTLNETEPGCIKCRRILRKRGLIV